MLWLSLVAENTLIDDTRHKRLVLCGVGVRARVYRTQAVDLSELRCGTLASIILTVRGGRVEVHK
jgi:hypothetical protein